MEHPFTNRLIHEKSPYLLQHAHNPVDWYPWGPEAFAASSESNKPIFLSIGYSTCHWCHVMEKESFENPEIAAQLNGTFICIKVDREELPEVDRIYMEFAQSMMAGSAGWPLNVVLTPDLHPFFSATYLPPAADHGLMGLTDLISKVKELWHSEEREQLILQAEKIVEVFAQSSPERGEVFPSKDLIEDSAELLFRMADPQYGGMRGNPKFPIGYQWSLLLRLASSQQDSRAQFVVEKSLDMMHRGGIYDHLGGGFSRYSVDEQWLIPHFEKMLYDNALISHAYLEAWQETKKPFYKSVCTEVIGYVLRDLAHSEGGFYSAEDADSEGHEGWFYTWPYDEIVAILGKEAAEIVCPFYGARPEGNFEGRNVLHTPLREEEFAKKEQLELEKLNTTLNEARNALFLARNQRERPFKDDKILASWNGLMIATLAEAGCAFNDPSYLIAASRAARFILHHLWQEGELLRRWRLGDASFKAGLDEYAFLIKGLLSLFEAGEGTEWLSWVFKLVEILEVNFKSEEGAFYQTDGMDPHLVLRKCQLTDGAEPSGNAVHSENLLRLGQITWKKEFRDQAEDIFRAVNDLLDQYPPGCCYHLIALDRYYNKEAPTLVVSLNERDEHFEELRTLLFEKYIPHKVVIWHRSQDQSLRQLLPFLENHPPLDGKTTFYICHQGVCQQPHNEIEAIRLAVLNL